MHQTIQKSLEELATFPGREEGLCAIGRYSLYAPVFYRSSDFSHSKRVAYLLASLEPVITKTFGSSFDMDRALTMALVHDDAELIIGDYQAGNKSKMTRVQLAQLDDEERIGIKALASRFPELVHGYHYKEMLEDVLDYGSLEAQVVKFIDRFDALGEAMHELYAGNVVFNTNVVNEFGTIPLPFEFYYQKLPAMFKLHPDLQPLEHTHVIFQLPEQSDWASVISKGKPYTLESLKMLTKHPQYDAWKKVVLEAGDEEEIQNLITQKEFLTK